MIEKEEKKSEKPSEEYNKSGEEYGKYLYQIFGYGSRKSDN